MMMLFVVDVQQVAEKAKLFTPTSSTVPTGDLLGWNVRFCCHD